MNRKDFQTLARIRLKEAKALFKVGCFDGAYYLAGYVVECGLKACIAKTTNRYDFPPPKGVVENIYTHDLGKLVKAAGSAEALKEAKAASADGVFAGHWDVVSEWSEMSRYARKYQPDAERILKAVSDSQQGVLRWIRKFW